VNVGHNVLSSNAVIVLSEPKVIPSSVFGQMMYALVHHAPMLSAYGARCLPATDVAQPSDE
jgi:hypothetical protein